MILSASRRTDIPTYYSDWMVNRLKAGYVLARNPMNLSQVSRVTLTPDLIDCIVFWTKDPEPIMAKLPLLKDMGYSYCFQFTLTPYGRDIERNLREKKDILNTFRRLSETIGWEKVLWRYDPIIINDDYPLEFHIAAFTDLCKELAGFTQSCTISFVDAYAKLKKDVVANVLKPICEEQMLHLASHLVEIGRTYGINLKVCCETLNLGKVGVIPSACIDKEFIEHICGHRIESPKDKSQRQGCGCIQSVDIGVYNTCKNGCIYCYANHSDDSILKNWLQHNSNSEILIGTIRDGDKIYSRN